MRHYCLVPGRLNKVVRLAAIFLLTLTVSKSGAQSQTAPAITVTVNKSMVFRLAERAKRVSVSQPGSGRRSCGGAESALDQWQERGYHISHHLR